MKATTKESITKLQERLADAKARVSALEAEKLEIEARQKADVARLKSIAKEMRSIVGRPAKSKKRAKNDRTLSAYIVDVLADGKSMRLKEIAQSVKDAGYKSKSKEGFLSCVATVLAKSEDFTKVERGVYTKA